jgi:ketosteroid isomerase-like protein
MKNLLSFSEFLNESAGDPAYWKQYEEGHPTSEPWMKEEAKTEAKVKELVNRVIEFWDEGNEDGGIVTKKGHETITKQAMDYFRKFRSINGHVIDAMVMQTQYVEYK